MSSTAPALNAATERRYEETLERRRRKSDRRDLLGAVVLSASFTVAAIALAVLATPARDLNPLLALAFAAAYALAVRIEFTTGAHFAVPTQLVFVPMLLLLPTPLVPLLVAAAYVGSDLAAVVRDRLAVGRAVIAPADTWFAIWPALVLVLGDAQLPSWDLWAWYAGALAAQLVGDAACTALRARLALGLRPREIASDMLLAYRVDALLFPVGLLAAVGAASQPWAVLLVLPIVALFASFAREREARIDGALELSQAYRGTALLLGDVIEADDAYTGQHTQDVVELTVAVADRLGVDAETRRAAEFGALLHDVGKVAIPNEIINKPGPLDDAEWEIMRTHTIEGQRMLDRVGGFMREVGLIVRGSHERFDGGGYPDGLAGEAIPFEARVIAACDAYNAMTTTRPYRAASDPATAAAELVRCAGTQFDPKVVEALLAEVGPLAGTDAFPLAA